VAVATHGAKKARKKKSSVFPVSPGLFVKAKPGSRIAKEMMTDNQTRRVTADRTIP
jgi:hypothetical protein